jgi:hypothetical protein
VAYPTRLKQSDEITHEKTVKRLNQLLLFSTAALLVAWNTSFRTARVENEITKEKARCTARRIVGRRHQFLSCHLDFDGRGHEAIRSSFDEAHCRQYCEKLGPQLPVGKGWGECVTSPIHDLNGLGSYLGCYLQSEGREIVHTPDVVSEVECATLCI